MLHIMTAFARLFGPVIPQTSGLEALRAGAGACVALAVVAVALLWPGVDPRLGFYLIAPFGASAVLLFAAPNSPLAQPWSVLIGNMAAAAVGVAACLLIPDASLRVAVAVGAAIAVMILLRALHPPGGAVAMTAALAPEATLNLGWLFVLAPVGLGSLALVLVAIFYARLTGRRYPFRQFDDKNAHGTADPAPLNRLGLSEAELVDILERYNQSMNLGVADLARLIGAAEMTMAGHQGSDLIAADIMSRDLVTVRESTPLYQVAALFRRHRFTSIPVTDAQGGFRGILFQLHLIENAAALLPRDQADWRRARSLWNRRPVTAAAVMNSAIVQAAPNTAISLLLPLMAETDCDAIPVLEQGRLVGLVTRTDVITALARQAAKASMARGDLAQTGDGA